MEGLAHTQLAFSLFEICGIWALAGVVFWVASRMNSLAVSLLLILPMTCLQQAFLTLLHDSWHGLFSKNKKLNDFIGRYAISFPCIKLWHRLKAEHLAHHVHLGDRQEDPTYVFYAFVPGEDRYRPLRFAFDRLGGRVIQAAGMAILGRFTDRQKPPQRVAAEAPSSHSASGLTATVRRELLIILVSQVVVFALITRVAPWWTYFVLWAFPLVSTTALCNLIRTFCEHSNPMTDDIDPRERFISFKSNWLELAFIAPLHFNYHAEHHLYMWVPHYKLPELRRRMMEASGDLSFPIRSSYARVLSVHIFGSNEIQYRKG